MTETIIISFNAQKSNNLVYSSKVVGDFVVQHIGSFNVEDKEIPTNNATVERFKRLIGSYYFEGYRLTSLSNTKGTGLSLNSTVVLTKTKA